MIIAFDIVLWGMLAFGARVLLRLIWISFTGTLFTARCAHAYDQVEAARAVYFAQLDRMRAMIAARYPRVELLRERDKLDALSAAVDTARARWDSMLAPTKADCLAWATEHELERELRRRARSRRFWAIVRRICDTRSRT